ncbi:Glycosyltransferase involved in cell wall bisynthesis [Salegentibacter holothuriorum]|uniref:Glycosyltransferase involved in cell wall bisynthesis n=1 Tax=Salegentibacter holothuriorum TaxID=241145 RepID=A0A1T5D0A4_9FLAO|nr:glycosyltransferase family 4 protein [Salegentibacter holothuriorum]SKB65089.1 Glycosyltransferase involved in cell wall bisynthesis [Salegentibacter holothuriorum]
MKIAILSPIAWRTPPEKYGPWEQVASNLTEGLVEKGYDVTLFATANSITKAKLEWASKLPYEVDKENDPKVMECLHISHLMEQAGRFDIIHNHFDFLPLTYSSLINVPMLTTIHGFSSPKIIPVYKKYNNSTSYVSISDSDRSEELDYLATIYHGLDPKEFTFRKEKEDYLLYFGRIHPHKGAHAAIEIARKAGLRLKIAGLIQEEAYFNSEIKPFIDNKNVEYLGNVGPEARDKLLGCAKALLHPIFFEEPFGLSVLEAMMCGTPVIAFKRGSMPELIREEISGFLPGNISEAVLAIKALDKIDPKTCRAYAVKKFSLETMTHAYLGAYETVIKNK